LDHGEESAVRAREEDRSSTESTSSSSSSSPSSSSEPPSDGGADGLDGDGSLVGPVVGELNGLELNGLELRSPKPKPPLGVSV